MCTWCDASLFVAHAVPFIVINLKGSNTLNFYRAQGKVMFSETCVILSKGRGRGRETPTPLDRDPLDRNPPPPRPPLDTDPHGQTPPPDRNFLDRDPLCTEIHFHRESPLEQLKIHNAQAFLRLDYCFKVHNAHLQAQILMPTLIW